MGRKRQTGKEKEKGRKGGRRKERKCILMQVHQKQKRDRGELKYFLIAKGGIVSVRK